MMSFESDSSLDFDDEGLMGGLPSLDSVGGLPFQASGSPTGNALRLSMGDESTDMAF